MLHPVLDTRTSPLRQRLIDDMNLRRFSSETQRNYLRDLGRLATFLGRSPDTATADDLRRFQIEQQEDGVPVRQSFRRLRAAPVVAPESLIILPSMTLSEPCRSRERLSSRHELPRYLNLVIPPSLSLSRSL